MKRKNDLKYLLIVSLLCFVGIMPALAYYLAGPYGGINSKKNQNFGMYRKYNSGLEEFHNGIDLSESIKSSSRPLIRAVAPGRVVYARWGKYGSSSTYNVSAEPHSIIGSYGKTVIIDHGGWFSKYSHLHQIYVSEESQVVAGQQLGIEGRSGKRYLYVFSADHLHLDIFNASSLDSILRGTDIDTSKLSNPIKTGMKIEAGPIQIKDAYFIKPGLDAAGNYGFGTADDKMIKKNTKNRYEVGWNLGMPLRIIVEAYEKASGYLTSPYMIQFKVYKDNYASSELVFNESIAFADLNFPDANGSGAVDVGDVYSFIPLADTKSSFYDYYWKSKKAAREIFYFYKKWYPEDPGDYKVIINVFKAYTDQSGNFVVELPADGSGTKELVLRVDMKGSFILPDENVGAASVGVRTAATGPEPLRVSTLNVSSAIFSPDPDVDDAPNNLNITVGANQEADWRIEISKNGSVVKTLNAPNGTMSEVVWDGKDSGGANAASGQYFCKVIGSYGGGTAIDTFEVTIDNDKPTLNSTPPQQYINSSTESVSLTFVPNEDVSVVVLALDSLSGNRIYEGPLATGNLVKNENLTVSWPDVARLPNGTYCLQIAMTDQAGKYNEVNIPVFVQIPGNIAPDANRTVRISTRNIAYLSGCQIKTTWGLSGYLQNKYDEEANDALTPLSVRRNTPYIKLSYNWDFGGGQNLLFFTDYSDARQTGSINYDKKESSSGINWNIPIANPVLTSFSLGASLKRTDYTEPNNSANDYMSNELSFQSTMVF